MGQPNHNPEPLRQGRPGQSDPGPQYGPLIPGSYPPLGYADDGTALYAPGQQTDTEKRRILEAQREERAAAARAERDARFAELRAEEDRPPWTRAPVIGLAAVALVAVLVTIFAFTRTGDDDLRVADSTIPPAPQPTRQQPSPPPPAPTDVPNFEDEFADDPPTPPQVPRPSLSIPRGSPIGYEVTLEGPGTIFYSDDTGLNAEFVPPSRWTHSFAWRDSPLHLTVIPAPNSAASCVIMVAGQELIRDEVTGDGAQNTARCVP